MFCYATYGLRIHSDLPLLGLQESDAVGEADVSVRVDAVGRRPRADEPQEGCFHATHSQAYLFWEGHGAYLVQDGREIIVDPSPEADREALGLVIVGIALGILMHQRGLLTLHASAVVVDGGAVAFLGDKGEGKSALAAALHAQGYSVVADDIVALDIHDTENPTVLPGFPQLKLWPDAVLSLGGEPSLLRQLHPQLEKRAHPVSRGFPELALPLRCIYVLTENTRLEVRTLQPQEAFGELMRHSYALRFLGSAGVSAAHFYQCASLASSVPVHRLERPCALSALPAVVQFLKEHLAYAVPALCE